MKKILSFVLTLALAFGMASSFAVSAYADDAPLDPSEPLEPAINSNHTGGHGYSFYYQWSTSVYLMDNPDDTYTRVETLNNGNVIEIYKSDGILTWKKSIPFELERFAGFYDGTDYNFLMYNAGAEDTGTSQEVFRVVKYTKNWHRVASASIYSSEFRSKYINSMRFVQVENLLYIHGDYSYTLKIDAMELSEIRENVADNHYVIADSRDIVACDHFNRNLSHFYISRSIGVGGRRSEDGFWERARFWRDAQAVRPGKPHELWVFRSFRSPRFSAKPPHDHMFDHNGDHSVISYPGVAQW